MEFQNALVWEITCLVRSAVPAPQVIERLRLRLPPSAVDAHPGETNAAVPLAGGGADPTALTSATSSPSSASVPQDPLDEAGQLLLLSRLTRDPVLAVLGLRPRYWVGLLKRLLGEVEARGLPVSDELADEYGEALMREAEERAAAAMIAAPGPHSSSSSSSAGWLYKTFAYGPAEPMAAAAAATEAEAGAAAAGQAAGCGDRVGQQLGSEREGALEAAPDRGSAGAIGTPSPVPRSSPVAVPVPEEVTWRHVACLTAALLQRGGGGGLPAAAAAATASEEEVEEVAVEAAGTSGESGWRTSSGGGGGGSRPGRCCRGRADDNPATGARGDTGSSGRSSSRGSLEGQLGRARLPCGDAAAPGQAAAAAAAAAAAGVAAAPGHGGCSGVAYPHGGRWGLVSLRVSDNLLAGSTGCHEWEASFALAQWVLNHPELFAGRRVLELGCGSGLVAVALHRAGAALVAATDGSDAAVANCAANLRLNGIRVSAAAAAAAVTTCNAPQLRPEEGPPEAEADLAQGRGRGREADDDAAAAVQGHLDCGAVVCCCRLSWEEPEAAECLNCELAVASDVLYDPEVVPIFVDLLAQLLRPHRHTAAESDPDPDLAPGGGGGGGGGSAPPRARPGPGPRPGPLRAAYIATLRRNPATLELFLRLSAEAALRLEEVDWREGSRGGGGGGVVFQHVAALSDPRVAERILLHRVSAT